MKRLPRVVFSALFTAQFILLTSCSVGPKYHLPEATTIPESYAAISHEWKVATPGAGFPKGNWWEMFGDEGLNRLEADAVSANQDLKAAFARFEQARAVADVARSGFFPQLSASFQSLRQHDSLNRPAGGHPGQEYSTYTIPFDLSYEIDLWGRVRSAAESAAAQMQAGADDLETMKLSIQAEVASDYITLRTLDAEKEILQSSIAAYQQSLGLVRNRRARGIVSDLDVAQAETILRSAEAQLTDTILQRQKLQSALALLTGKNASIFRLEEKTLEVGTVMVPAGLPSELLERRPDIAAAERRMAAANAGIGVARAAFYPTIRFSGQAGLQSGDAGMLFDWPSRLWALGPSVTLPLFDGGQRRASLRQSEAVFLETVARYRQIVLAAFSEVENNLAAEHLLRKEYEQQTAALRAVRRQLEIAENRYRSGLVTYLEVATAQNAALGAERTAMRLKGQQMIAAVALVKALGGGWQMADLDAGVR